MPPVKSSFLNSRKPFKLLTQLTSSELKLLHEFLRHPPFVSPAKSAQKVLELYERCLSLDIRKKLIQKADFLSGTTLPNSANAFDKLISVFYDRIQEFLAVQQLKKNPGIREQLAFQAYQDRAFSWKEIRRRHNEALRELDKLPQSSQLANSRWMLGLDLASFANDRSVPPEERGYPELLAVLEANYTTQKFRLLCAIANDQKIFKASETEPFETARLPTKPETWPILTQMYFFVYQILTGQANENSIQELNQLLDAQNTDDSDYPRADMLDLYGYLLNAHARDANLGKPHALKRLSKLHNQLIAKGIILENGLISAEHFKNVISVKIKTGEIISAREYFDQLSENISNDPDRNASRYNNAFLLYAENNLVDAARELEILCGQTGNLKLDQFYGLDMRVHLLKVYFDLLNDTETNHLLWDETDEKMVRLLESFKGYIERRKIPEKRRKNFESFRLLIQMAYAYAFGSNTLEPESYQVLLSEIENSSVSVKSWFVNRLVRIA